MKIHIKSQELPEYYGDTVVFDEGYLAINMFDGCTKLDKEEAKELAEALLKYAND